MKKLSTLIICLLAASKLFAQDCSNYAYLKKGKVVETTAYNAAGKVMQKSVDHVSDVSTNGGMTVATVNAEHFDANGHSKGKATLFFKCSGGSYFVDYNQNSGTTNGNLEGQTSYIEYPANMAVGDHFPDVTIHSSQNFGNRPMTFTIKITNRTVVDKESITTPAGTWEAFKITYTTTTAADSGGNIGPQSAQTTQWFVPNLGIVQFETHMAYNMFFTVKVTSIQ